MMVQDVTERLPVMAQHAYRSLAAALIVDVVCRHQLRRVSAAGRRAGLLMGAFLTAGYVFQTLGLEHTSVSNAGFITGMFVVLTPVFGAVFLRERIGTTAWAGALVAGIGLYLLSGAGGDFSLE